MANNDSRFEDLKQEINRLKEDIKTIQDKQFNQCMVQKDDKAELKELIVNAVKEAVEDVQSKTFSEIEKIREERSALEARIKNLEDKDGKLAIKILFLILSTIITTTAGWVVLGYLNNQNAIAASNSIVASEVKNNG